MHMLPNNRIFILFVHGQKVQMMTQYQTYFRNENENENYAVLYYENENEN